MTVKELIEDLIAELRKLPPDLPVKIVDTGKSDCNPKITVTDYALYITYK